jgi:hypothetical protein
VEEYVTFSAEFHDEIGNNFRAEATVTLRELQQILRKRGYVLTRSDNK